MKNSREGKTAAFAFAAVLLAALAAALARRAAIDCLVCPMPYGRETEEASARFGVERALLYAVMKAESGFRADAESRTGARGLMQISPSTGAFIAERLGTDFDADDLFDPSVSVTFGAWYLGYLLGRFPLREALAAYNAGEGTVREWLSDPECSADGATLFHVPYPETEAYLRKVEKNLENYRKYRG